MLLSHLFLWLHILGVVAWIGGIIYVLVVLMPAVPKIALRDRANFVPLILRRFLAVVWTSVGLILVTGLYRIFWVWDAAQSSFWGTPVGRVLMEKLTLFGVILVVVGLVTFRAVPRAIAHVATHQGDAPDAYACKECATVVGSLKRHLQVGLAVALLIIFWAVRLRGG
jgi:uncharacterized membrane protein